MQTVIYLRKSREDLDKEDSLEKHRKMLTDLCNNKGWEYEIYEEIGSSQSLEKREEINKIINLIKKGICRRLVVMDIDRLSRENYDLAYLRKLFTTYNIELVTPYKTYNWSQESDLMMFGFNSLIGENEFRQIRKRMLQGKQIGAENGNWVTGEPPLGYKRDRNTGLLELVDSEVKLVRYIVECYLSGNYSSNTLAYHLNKMGYRGRRGALWDSARLYTLMNNRAYLGEVKYNDVWYKGKHQALISLEEWEDLHMQLKGNRIIVPRKTIRSKKKLSGFCKCGICGRGLTVIVDYSRNKNFIKCNYKDKLTGERCRNRGVQEEVILEQLEIAIGNHIADLQNFIDNKNNVFERKQVEALKKNIEEIDKQITKIKNRIENTKEMTKEGLITLAECKEELKKANNKIIDLQQEKEALKRRVNHLNRDLKIELLHYKRIFNKLENSTCPEEYNELLRSIVKRITIKRINDNLDVDIDFL